VNATVVEGDSDMGAGAVYHDNRVKIRLYLKPPPNTPQRLPERLCLAVDEGAHHPSMPFVLSPIAQLADLELAHDEAIALFHQGDLDQAFEDLHGISLHHNVSPHLRIRCLLAMGQILDVNGREQDAIALFQQVWYDGAAT